MISLMSTCLEKAPVCGTNEGGKIRPFGISVSDPHCQREKARQSGKEADIETRAPLIITLSLPVQLRQGLSDSPVYKLKKAEVQL